MRSADSLASQTSKVYLLRNIAQNCAILPSNIAQKLVGNIAQYCTILRNIAQYCAILHNIAQYCKPRIAQYCAIFCKIVQSSSNFPKYCAILGPGSPVEIRYDDATKCKMCLSVCETVLE